MTTLREAGPADMAGLAALFYRAVQIGAAPAYSRAQRDVWAGKQPTETAWAARLDGLLTLLAEQDGAVVGFMSMRMGDGYLDLAFVEPDARGTGVAAMIYAELEERARLACLKRLFSHASHLAKPFLVGQGWRVIRPNAVERHGVTLDNWLMEKSLY